MALLTSKACNSKHVALTPACMPAGASNAAPAAVGMRAINRDRMNAGVVCCKVVGLHVCNDFLHKCYTRAFVIAAIMDLKVMQLSGCLVAPVLSSKCTEGDMQLHIAMSGNNPDRSGPSLLVSLLATKGLHQYHPSRHSYLSPVVTVVLPTDGAGGLLHNKISFQSDNEHNDNQTSSLGL